MSIEAPDGTRLRLVERPDFEAVAALRNAAEPFQPRTAELLADQNARRLAAGCVSRWVLAEGPEGLRGFAWGGHYPFQFEWRRPLCTLIVAAQWRRRGVGTALWTALRSHLADLDPEHLTVDTFDGGAAVLAFAARHGFQPKARFFDLHRPLDPSEGSLARQVALAAEGADLEVRHGVRVQAFAEVATEPGFWAVHRDLVAAISPDLPGHSPPTVPTEAVLRRESWENPRFWAEASFVARAGAAHVAVSTLWRTPTPGQADVGITAVRGDWRRRGLARHLKARAAAVAAAAGIEHLRTGCNDANQAILALNHAEGYRAERVQTWWRHMVVPRS